jgi:hypothetical protein
VGEVIVGVGRGAGQIGHPDLRNIEPPAEGQRQLRREVERVGRVETDIGVSCVKIDWDKPEIAERVDDLSEGGQ